jgi:eukaryotic-like serine/threonine-protein kinase
MDLLAKVAPRGSVIGRYLLLDEVAAGAMATVSVARVRGDTLVSDTVSVKRLHAGLLRDADFVATAVEEARRAAAIHHPNLLVPQDVVLVGSRELLFVSPYVPGETLAILFGTCFRGGIRMPPAIAAAVIRDVLRGLHAAHEAVDDRGRPMAVIHRGVSPQNILVGLDGQARLFDFGPASGRMRARTMPAVFAKGKSSYMSPEQIRRQPVDRRTDIFATGAILWELLSGERLFRDTGEAELTRQITQHHIPPPSSIQPSAPAALDAIVARALQRSPGERFATAAEFADALEAALPLASPAEIGPWVEELDGDRLRARAQLVALAESATVEPLRESEIQQSFSSTRETRPRAMHESGHENGHHSGHDSDQEGRPPREPPPWARPLPVYRRRPRTAGRRGRTVAGLGLLAAAAVAIMALRAGDPPAPALPAALVAPAIPAPGAAPPERAAAVGAAGRARAVARQRPPAPAGRSKTAARTGARPGAKPAPAPAGKAATKPATKATTKAATKATAKAASRPAAKVASKSAPRDPGKAGPPVKATHAFLKIAPGRVASGERSRARAPVAAAPRSEGPSAGCDPPFTVDADGIRRIKRQCLR